MPATSNGQSKTRRQVESPWFRLNCCRERGALWALWRSGTAFVATQACGTARRPFPTRYSATIQIQPRIIDDPFGRPRLAVVHVDDVVEQRFDALGMGAVRFVRGDGIL